MSGTLGDCAFYSTKISKVLKRTMFLSLCKIGQVQLYFHQYLKTSCKTRNYNPNKSQISTLTYKILSMLFKITASKITLVVIAITVTSVLKAAVAICWDDTGCDRSDQRVH